MATSDSRRARRRWSLHDARREKRISRFRHLPGVGAVIEVEAGVQVLVVLPGNGGETVSRSVHATLHRFFSEELSELLDTGVDR